ncbi:MAG: hypothetical protein ACRCWM_03140 [Sarcina sp.]
MTVFGIGLFLIVGLIALVIGNLIKKKWLIIISIIALVISIFQVLTLIVGFM